MSKLILFLSFVSLGVLLAFGLAAPDSPVMWLASSSSGFAWLRMALMAILFGLMITTPPRNVIFRVFVGLFSVGLIGWCLNATYNNQMGFADTLSLLAASLAAGIVVLERDVYEARERALERATARLAKFTVSHV
jgi:hypothetical protein